LSQKATVLKRSQQLHHEALPSQRVDQGPADPLFSVPSETFSIPDFSVIPDFS
jgi:hypothetical protein